MEFFSLLYDILIGPLELFFEVVFSLAFRFLGSVSLSIVFLSLAMNFLVLPLYRRADAIQEQQRDRSLAMKPWNDHIKKTFTGDERFMMQQAYNRQMGYKPTDVFKGSISLLLEIPFFIAAFHFLSNLEMLHGIPLGPIADLGAPDALLQLGSLSLNLLPILMTAINVISAAIYLKGFPVSSKIQTYGIAVVFLVLLYNSPAGLVFYWTLNNIFSLAKNVFYKLPNPKFVLMILAAFVGIALPLAVALAQAELSPLRIFLLGAAFLLLELPLAQHLLNKTKTQIHLPRIGEATESDNRNFLLGCLFLAILIGALIPLSVINASPTEFVNVAAYRSPLWFVAHSCALAFGTFVVWFGVFYWLATPKGKTIFAYLVLVSIAGAIVNYLFFGLNYGNLSPELRFTQLLEIPTQTKALNFGVLLLVAAALFFFWKWKRETTRIVYGGLCVAVAFMSAINTYNIHTYLDTTRATAAAGQEQKQASIPLSKNAKNVVVIMLDRALPQFIPYIFSEKPELKEQFSGFTSYQNTISYGPVTNIGTPALYGGIDYRPEHMNERSNESLKEKHNEALKVMPTLFTNLGYHVTLIDPTYAGYEYTPNLSLFEGMPHTEAYITLNQSFINAGVNETDIQWKNKQLSKNFFCYSLFKTAPLYLQYTLYQEGTYNSTTPLSQIRHSYSVAEGIDPSFKDSYDALGNYPSLTKIHEHPEGNLVLMVNNATHEATILEEPSYTPRYNVNNENYDAQHPTRETEDGNSFRMFDGSNKQASERITLYQVNMATMLQLGKWFDYLREASVYDNTRIILVSDHAWENIFSDDLVVPCPSEGVQKNPTLDLNAFNCLLMVKDFNSTGFSYNDQFMTNADVPALALDGLVSAPRNPFSGTVIDYSYKTQPQKVLYSLEWDIRENNGNTFLPGYWFSVHSDTRLRENWEYLGYN